MTNDFYQKRERKARPVYFKPRRSNLPTRIVEITIKTIALALAFIGFAEVIKNLKF